MFCVSIAGPIVTIGNFYINQQEIEKRHCENKNKPEMDCKGHCYLKKQLSQKSDFAKELPQSKLKSIVFLFYRFDKTMAEQTPSHLDYSSKSFYAYINNYQLLLASYILDPPQKLIRS